MPFINSKIKNSFIHIFALSLWNITRLLTKQRLFMGERKLTRSNDRMLAGVCAGIAEYFDWDITLLRIVYVLATIFTAFSGVIVYIILWILMPERK